MLTVHNLTTYYSFSRLIHTSGHFSMYSLEFRQLINSHTEITTQVWISSMLWICNMLIYICISFSMYEYRLNVRIRLRLDWNHLISIFDVYVLNKTMSHTFNVGKSKMRNNNYIVYRTFFWICFLRILHKFNRTSMKVPSWVFLSITGTRIS